MAQKESRKSSHLNNDLDPSFDLDDYLNEQASKTASAVEEEPDDPAYRTKNVILFALVIATATLWYFDWSPRQMYAFFFGNNADAAVTEVIPPIDINIPPIEVNIPDITIPTPPSPPVAEAPPAPPSIAMGTVIDYLNQLNERGLLTDNLLSAFEARELYSARVPVEYLVQLNTEGYLGRLSFVEIDEFYNENIPLSYLTTLDQAGYLDRLSFVEIGEFFQNGVPLEYLDQLDEAGYLDELSFVHITEYYENGVTTEFLDRLKEIGLYDELSFIDVVELYKDEN